MLVPLLRDHQHWKKQVSLCKLTGLTSTQLLSLPEGSNGRPPGTILVQKGLGRGMGDLTPEDSSPGQVLPWDSLGDTRWHYYTISALGC